MTRKTAQQWKDELNLERLPAEGEVAVFDRAATKAKALVAYTPTDPEQLRSLLGEAMRTWHSQNRE